MRPHPTMPLHSMPLQPTSLNPCRRAVHRTTHKRRPRSYTYRPIATNYTKPSLTSSHKKSRDDRRTKPYNAIETVERLRPTLEHYRDEGERERRLPDAVVSAMKQEGLFELWLPRSTAASKSASRLHHDDRRAIAHRQRRGVGVANTGTLGCRPRSCRTRRRARSFPAARSVQAHSSLADVPSRYQADTASRDAGR